MSTPSRCPAVELGGSPVRARAAAARTSGLEPTSEVRRDEAVVGEVGIRGEHAVDLGSLARREVLVRIKAQAPSQKALTAQHLVDPRDAAREAVRRVEERSVDVSQL